MQPVRTDGWVTVDQNFRDAEQRLQALQRGLDSIQKSVAGLSAALKSDTPLASPLPALPSDTNKYLRGDLTWVRPVSWGTFTLAAAATTVVADTNATASSVIVITPTNATGAALMAGAKSLYISARSAGVSFTVATADASAAAGVETFNYIMTA